MPTQTISLRDQRYPALLKEIHDPPARIFVRGELPPPDALCVSVVGTRRMSAYGARVVQLLVPPLARAGAIIVSGLAFGVDAAAHALIPSVPAAAPRDAPSEEGRRAAARPAPAPVDLARPRRPAPAARVHPHARSVEAERTPAPAPARRLAGARASL